MEKTLIRISVFLGLALSVFLAPAAQADSSLPTSQWNFYQYANEVTPSTTIQHVIHIKNTTGVMIDAISGSVPNLNACLLVTGVAAQYDSSGDSFTGPTTFPSATCSSGVSGFNVGSSGTDSLKLGNGASVTIFLNMTVGCITSSYPTCDTVATHTTQGDWQNLHYFHFATTTPSTPFSQWDAIGNTTFKVTNTPNPMQQPLDWGRDNPYASGLKGTGIASPTAISGLFPPGPLDSLIILPITLTNQILTAAGGTVVRPTTTVLGHTMTFPTPAGIYGVIGTTATTMISTALSFFLLLPWLKSIYARVQRATSLDSHHNDTWGVL